MTSEIGESAIAAIFGRLLESSRRLLGRHQTATLEEISSLSALIEKEIIPRLQMTFPTPQRTETATPASTGASYDIPAFVAALLSNRPNDARDHISALVDDDHSLIEIYEHLLTPAARQLGALWEDDLASFAEVTIAITKIRHIFVSTAPLFPVYQADDDPHATSILLTTVPGEQHTFGLYLAVEAFREAGWSVWSGTPRSTQELIDLVAREHYDCVGLSVVAEKNQPLVAEAISNIRRHAANRDIKVILGGRLVNEKPETVQHLDVDLIATDSEAVIREAGRLLGLVRPV